MSEQRVFLGWADPNRDWADHPLVRPWDGDPAATWPYGPGGAPHLRVVGTTGGGKTTLLRMLLRGLVRRPGPRGILVIDGEGAGEFTAFEGMPGVVRVVNVNPAADAKLADGQPRSVQVAAEVIASTLAEAVERNEAMMAAQAAWRRHLVDPAHVRPPTYVPPAELVLVIDGWATLLHVIRRYLKSKMDVVEDAILIGRNGRKVDVHLVVADQVMYASRSKDDAGFPSELKKQLAAVVAAVGPLGLTETEGRMAFDDPAAGKLIPRRVGGCLLQVGATRVPFVCPPWLNPTTADPLVGSEQRRAAYRLLPPPLDKPEAVA
jgi:Helicase HerA, central domain